MPHFGPYRKQREEQLRKIHLNTNPLAEESEIANGVGNNNGFCDNTVQIPRINDIIGLALPKIGAYKQLDNTKQVVALIDDVIKHSSCQSSRRLKNLALISIKVVLKTSVPNIFRTVCS